MNMKKVRCVKCGKTFKIQQEIILARVCCAGKRRTCCGKLRLVK